MLRLVRVQTLICCLSVLWSVCSAGEIVQVKTPKPTSGACSPPKQFTVAVTRQNDVIEFSLTKNVILTSPNSVVLMTSEETNDVIDYRRVEVRRPLHAYHNPDLVASIIVTCSKDKYVEFGSYTLEGTLFIDGSKFKMHPTSDDVKHGKDYVSATYHLEEVTEFNDPKDHQYIGVEQRAHATKPKDTDHDGEGESLKRSKRSVGIANYIIDVLPVIDYNLFQSWLANNNDDVAAATAAMTTYMTNVFTAMSVRVGTLDLGNEIKLSLRMMAPHVSTSLATSKYSEDNKVLSEDGSYSINVTTLLDAFRGWVVNTNSLPKTDHTMLFTGYNVFGGNDGEVGSNLTRGLAYLSTICQTDGYSSSVVQDQMAYQSEPVAVHELGHSLGSKHDGEDNSCSSSDRYIMADGTYTETLDNSQHPYAFSSCSSTAVRTTIKNLEGTDYLNTCLTDTIGVELSTIRPLSATDQCQALFGASSYVCRGAAFPTISDVCTDMNCAIPNQGYCRKLMAATGTCCGNGKYCMEGKCVSGGPGQCVMNEQCPLEDRPGIVQELGSTCQEMHPSLCYTPSIYDQCCRTCEAHRAGPRGCEYGDKHSDCNAGDCNVTLASGVKYDFICCKTCQTNACNDRSAFNFQSKRYTCPEFIDDKGKHYCYFQPIHNSACCETCNSKVSQDPLCLYGDKVHKFNCYKIPPLNRSCTAYEETLCCETCATLKDLPSGGEQPTGSEGEQTTRSDVSQTTCVGIICSNAQHLSASFCFLVMVLFFKCIFVRM